MIEGIRGVFLNNRPLGVQSGNFRDGLQGVHEDGHEEHRALRVEPGSGLGASVEDGSDDERHNQLGEDGRQGGRAVVPDELVGALRAEPDLHGDGDAEGRLGADVLGLTQVLVLAEGCDAFTLVLAAVGLFVAGDVLLQSLELGGAAPVFFKVLGCSGHSVFHAWLSDSFGRVGHRGEEVSGGLTGGTMPTHLLKVGFGGRSWAEEDLATFVEHDRLVEKVVDVLAGLVNSYHLGSATNIGSHSQ